MPSKYIPTREKVITFIKETLIPAIKGKRKADYEKAIDLIVVNNGVSRKVAQECLNAIINLDFLKRNENGELVKGSSGAIKL